MMMTTPQSPIMTVRLRESTVARLMALRVGADDSLDNIVGRLAHGALSPNHLPEASAPPIPARQEPQRIEPRPTEGRYALIILGETLLADTLSELFSAVVEILCAIAPEAIEKLAAMHARTRAFVSRNREDIHPGRPDLRLRQSPSGWWVSANIGTEDLKRALRAACEASGLLYDRDIRFIGRDGHHR